MVDCTCLENRSLGNRTVSSNLTSSAIGIFRNTMKKSSLLLAYSLCLHAFALVGFVFTIVFFGMQFGVFNVRGSISDRNAFFAQASSTAPVAKKDDYKCIDGTKVCDIFLTPEWQTVSFGLQKDSSVITEVSKETGVPARLIASLAVPEQMRFFSAERESYKKYFEPLKVLGTMSQFSLGVTGIKPKTATEIEDNLHATTSPYYLGETYEHILDYREGEERDETQYKRLTDSKNHYYSYLYTALFIKQIETSWKNAGHPIASEHLGVYATLFNLGFSKSNPNDAPKLGGAVIKVGGKSYTYGDIADIFLKSDKLTTEFPK